MLQIKDYTSLNTFRNSRQLLTGIKSGTNDHVFIKIRNFDINEEAKITNLLSDSLGFPHFFYYGIENTKSILITSQLGKSLQNLFYESNLNFSLKTLLMIADQMLQRLEFLFHVGIAHGRISPEHILIDRVSTQNSPSTLYLINFEHSEKIKSNFDIGVKVPFNLMCQNPLSIASSSGNFDEIPLKKYNCDSSSNAEDFLPASVICKEELTPKSDLESLLYVLVYFFNHGKLPWSSEKSTVDHKASILAEDLCAGMPREFTIFSKMIKSLGPDDVPNYSEYRSLFRNLFMKKKYVYDGIFDWNKAKIISFNFDDNFEYVKSASSNINLVPNAVNNARSTKNSNSSTPILLGSAPRMFLRSNPSFSRNYLPKPPQYYPYLSPIGSQERLKLQKNQKEEEKEKKVEEEEAHEQLREMNISTENEIPINSDELLYPKLSNEQNLLPKHHHKHSKHKHKHKRNMIKQIPNIDFGESSEKNESYQGSRNKHRSNSLKIPQPPQNPVFHMHQHSPSQPSQYFNAYKTNSAPIPDLHGFTYTMKQAQSAAYEYVSSLPKKSASGTRGRSFSVNNTSSSTFT